MGHRFPFLVNTTAAFLLLSTSGLAQPEQQKEWSFEDGKFPADLLRSGTSSDAFVQVVDVAGIPELQSSARPGTAKVGQYVLALRASTSGPAMFGALVEQPLEREQLGKDSTAIFEADFFVPGTGELPNVALLAAEPVGADAEGAVSVSSSFYRFGLRSNSAVYFSHLVLGEDKPVVYVQDENVLTSQAKSGWHRFTLAFVGTKQIRFFVNGQECSFSPMEKPELSMVRLGVLLAETRKTYDCYVDNLSMRVTTDGQLPVISHSGSDPSPRIPDSVGSNGNSPSLAPPEWLEPVEAWQEAQRLQRPLLLYFHDPQSAIAARLEKTMQSDEKAKQFLARHSLAKVDLARIEGKELARKYGVYRIPTLLIISPDAQSSSRATFKQGDTWDELVSRL